MHQIVGHNETTAGVSLQDGPYNINIQDNAFINGPGYAISLTKTKGSTMSGVRLLRSTPGVKGILLKDPFAGTNSVSSITYQDTPVPNIQPYCVVQTGSMLGNCPP